MAFFRLKNTKASGFKTYNKERMRGCYLEVERNTCLEVKKSHTNIPCITTSV